METAESPPSSHVVPSDRAVAVSIREGLQDVVIQSLGGFIVGGLAGVVLARGGGQSSARKVLAGFGGGVGCGVAWTRTSMRLEDMLRVPDPKK
jgi:outer membrane lipoprotein SlyB